MGMVRPHCTTTSVAETKIRLPPPKGAKSDVRTRRPAWGVQRNSLGPLRNPCSPRRAQAVFPSFDWNLKIRPLEAGNPPRGHLSCGQRAPASNGGGRNIKRFAGVRDPMMASRRALSCCVVVHRVEWGCDGLMAHDNCQAGSKRGKDQRSTENWNPQ
jgi:hypothetical protein